jgi:hypothetical protein
MRKYLFSQICNFNFNFAQNYMLAPISCQIRLAEFTASLARIELTAGLSLSQGLEAWIGTEKKGSPAELPFAICPFPFAQFFAGAAPASVYSPVHVILMSPSAGAEVVQVPDPLMPFILPVPPVT